jgi:hypothetical protein
MTAAGIGPIARLDKNWPLRRQHTDGRNRRQCHLPLPLHGEVYHRGGSDLILRGL